MNTNLKNQNTSSQPTGNVNQQFPSSDILFAIATVISSLALLVKAVGESNTELSVKKGDFEVDLKSLGEPKENRSSIASDVAETDDLCE